MKIEHIQVTCQQLPEHYPPDDPCMDSALEYAIVSRWRRNPAYGDLSISVDFGVGGEEGLAWVVAYNEDGDVVFERDDHNINYAIEYAFKFC